ncbi:hypothetical protein ACFFX0_02615 [Citricoccus parietis]|uniref:Secreted protein n=1 Tax=Citricoccus parietis TaxID=592307 RepID=A0ABV5FTX9_9MICC
MASTMAMATWTWWTAARMGQPVAIRTTAAQYVRSQVHPLREKLPRAGDGPGVSPSPEDGVEETDEGADGSAARMVFTLPGRRMASDIPTPARRRAQPRWSWRRAARVRASRREG